MARERKTTSTPQAADQPLLSLTPSAPRPSSTGGRQWTEQQRQGIETTGCGLLVSAAAGSGKTAVLAARCEHLVCDATPPCDIDQLLVVTFTEAAAAEMKSRIEHSLRRRYERDQTEHLARQLALIEHAQVSTLHGFCTRLLRQHFQLLELDPSFAILDGDEATLLRNEIARELFADHYEQDETGSFQRLVEAYCDGNDDRLLRWLVHTHELLCSVADPSQWRQRALERITQAAEAPLTDSELGREFLADVQSRLTALRERCAAAIQAIPQLGDFPKYMAQLRELEQILAHWDGVLRGDGLDALSEEVASLELPRLPSVPNATANKEPAKAWMDSIREQMTKGKLGESLRFSESQWCEGLRSILPHAQVFLGLVEEFAHRYAAAKKAARTVDFSDMERLALQILRDPSQPALAPSPVARLYHRQFHHVLVDEYQDINEVQDAILTLVSRECVAQQQDSAVASNLFCVGDVKQSIYRFRLAEPRRFLDRQQRFRHDKASGGKVIDLQANFRSRGALLGAINQVFARLMTQQAAEIEYDQTHYLHEGLKYPTPDASCFAGAPVDLHLLPSKLAIASDADADDQTGEGELERAEAEAILLVRLIHELTGHGGGTPRQVMQRGDDGTLSPRPVRYSDIVILLRSLRFKADQYADVLRQAGIPVHSESGTGYFQSMEVRDMLALLQLLDNQRQDIPMAAVLRSPLATLPVPEDCLARIRLAYRGGELPVPFHEAVVRYAREQPDELAAKLTDFLRQLSQWREIAHRRPLAELIWTIYEETGYLAFCSGLADGEQRAANLIHLHERAQQFGTFQRQGLHRFLRFLDSLESETDLGQPSVASEADNVVRIMSVHRSKGLEFPIVLLPDLGKRFNLQDCTGQLLVDRTAYLGMSVVDEPRRVRYPSLAWTMVQDRLRRQALAEELRVLYVAMTRAKEHLVLIGTCGDSTPDKWASMWGRHAGPLPADMVLGAACMLDWLGPVAAATHSATPQPIRIVRHDADEIAQWTVAAAEQHPALSEEQSRLADLRPLDPPPQENPAADAIIARLGFQYPHQSFAMLAASQSITGWTRHGRVLPPGFPHLGDADAQRERTLPVPRCAMDQARPSAVDRGVATHLVLQYLDFTRSFPTPGTTANASEALEDLASQVHDMVQRRLITPAHASMVDVDAIAWLAGSDIGKLLRNNHKRLLRELPFHYAVPPQTFDGVLPSSDPLDQIMIRGRIDVLVPLADGLILIDYKTDHVPAELVQQKAESYRLQVERYRDAVEKMSSQRVLAVHLVFLHPRVIWSP